MLNAALDFLGRVLHPNERTMEPGRFESFLGGVAELQPAGPRLDLGLGRGEVGVEPAEDRVVP